MSFKGLYDTMLPFQEIQFPATALTKDLPKIPSGAMRFCVFDIFGCERQLGKERIGGQSTKNRLLLYANHLRPKSEQRIFDSADFGGVFNS